MTEFVLLSRQVAGGTPALPEAALTSRDFYKEKTCQSVKYIFSGLFPVTFYPKRICKNPAFLVKKPFFYHYYHLFHHSFITI